MASTPHAQLPSAATVLGQAETENFPVAARILPLRTRQHLRALYGFFRLTDYAGDEAPGHRETLLDLLELELKRVYSGTPRIPLLMDLVPTVRECRIPQHVLVRVILANRQDQRVHRYGTYSELLDYCALSANPVGESVLYVFGRPHAELIGLSDKVCTALQILEHCQDLAQDYRQGRIYLPSEDLESFGCYENDLAADVAAPRLRRLVKFEVGRATTMLSEGAPLVGHLSGFARVAVAGFVAGGRATAGAFTQAVYDPMGAEVQPGRVRTVGEWARVWLLGGSL